MSITKHHQLRMMMKLSSRDEYVIGMLYDEGEVKTTFFHHIGLGPTIKDVVKRLQDRGLIQIRKDKNRNMLSLTDYGREYVRQVKELYAGRNDSK
jgi:DNA-binding MarR family transcriptional regulator